MLMMVGKRARDGGGMMRRVRERGVERMAGYLRGDVREIRYA